MNTVVCRDNSNARHGYEPVLLYSVTADLNDIDAVMAEIIEARKEDVNDVNPEDIEILFALAGDVMPIADWRD